VKVLSLFDGISAAQVALQRLGVKDYTYYASEVDKYAIKITQKNFPNTIKLGDVSQLDYTAMEDIDLLIGGSPCQGFSFAGKQLNFEDERSKLFFEYVRALKVLKPKYFLLENVKMKKEYQDVISEQLGVEPVEINSALLSAQNRKRLYWCNWKVEKPEDLGIFLKDVLIDEGDPICYSSSGRGNGKVETRISSNEKAHTLTKAGYSNRSLSGVIQLVESNESNGRQPYQQNRVYSDEGKSPCLSADGARRTNVKSDYIIRKLHPIECERLQTFPDNYTEGISNTQRYKALGNSFTVDVIAHILRGIL
jgi:DNA-cytosine methyltransferase